MIHDMSHTDPRHAELERLRIAVRLALHPREPWRIPAYVELAEALARSRKDGWQLLEHTFHNLIASANDPLLPFAWRVSCIDHTYLPYRAMYTHPDSGRHSALLHELGRRLATTRIFEPGRHD